MTTFFRYFHTLRYVKFSQILWRLYYRFRKVDVDLADAPDLRKADGPWQRPGIRTKRMLGRLEFEFLNETGRVSEKQDWNNSAHTKLWLYNLHYFDDLNASDAGARVNWHTEMIDTWIDENPPGDGNGWEPYPLSLRIVNWIKWAQAGNKLTSVWRHSLAVQVRYLCKRIEWHLLGNHLFANAKALIFAGLYFNSKEADRWYENGMAIYQRELSEQVLPDGGNFELSTMYHSIFTEDLLDILNVHERYDINPPDDLTDVLVRMLNWLMVMSHPDGEISLFNDAAFNVAVTPKELFAYANRLGVSLQPRHDNVSYLKDSGYARVNYKNMVLLADLAAIGPDYLPGHAHADTLSFELSLYDERLFVNSGTSVYGTGKQRLLERKTAAHNTVVIDGEDSSEVWSGFRVARRARVTDVLVMQENDGAVIKASHNGYKRLSGMPVHSREWAFFGGQLQVTDLISGSGRHVVTAMYHLHPGVCAEQSDKEEFKLITSQGNQLILRFSGFDKISLESYFYHDEFGKSQTAQVFRCQTEQVLPLQVEAVIKH